jgi:HK97 family phage major capsid protein
MDVLEILRSTLRERLAERDAFVAEMETITAAAEAEQRSELSADETLRFTELREAIQTQNAEIEEIEARINEGSSIMDAATEAREAAIPSEETDATEARVSVKSEAMTYRQGGSHSYFKDLALAQAPGVWDGEARARLQRHADETAIELRTNMSRTDGQGGEFVPPLWLLNQFVSLARAGRVTADLSSKFELPAGTDSINLPKISGGSTVTATTDNSAASNTDMTTATVTAPVNTYAGQQVFALSLLEQSPINFDQVVFADLIAAHAAAIGSAVIAGGGTSGAHEGILTNTATNSVTYTATTPTGTGVYTAIAQAVSQVAKTRFLPAQAIVMNPQRWYWLSSQADGNGRPLVVPNAGGPFNAVGVMTDAQAQGSVGAMLGLPVYLDPNIGSTYSTNQDRVIVARFSDLALFEGAPRTRVLFETDANTLQVRLQVYSYSAFTSRRYSGAISVCSGTGFAAPSGY